MISRELSKTNTPNPEDLISKLGMLLGKVNKSKIKLFNTKNIEDNKNTVENVFNVQHDKLNFKFIKSQRCCLTSKTQNMKISARLKREAGNIATCACLGQNIVHGRQIKNIVGGEEHRRLKIFVRI